MDWVCAPLQGLVCCKLARNRGSGEEDGFGTWHEACNVFDASGSVTYAAESRASHARRGLGSSDERPLAGVGIIFVCSENGALAVSPRSSDEMACPLEL